jgi:peptidoglycan/LPS O-acetylase OafA/YrhL
LDTQKLLALESIRGIAAFVVVWWHFTSVLLPAVINGPSLPAHGAFEQWIYQTPLSIFFAGNFAVVLFFVLSGFVLTYKFMAGRQDSLFPAAIKRYVRLMPIAAISVILAYLLLATGLMFAGHIAGLTGSPWATVYYGFDPTLLGALWQATVGVFQTQAAPHATYNPVLWTIYYELLGSLLIFGLATLTRNHPKRWLLYIIATVAFSGTYFCGFIVGMIIADLYANRRRIFERIGKLALPYKLALLGLALIIGGYPALGDASGFGIYYQALTLFPSDIALSRTILQLIAAVIIITLALSWVRMARVLEWRPLVWLGKVSYSLYATHFIVIYSLTSGLFMLFTQWWGYKLSAVVAMAVSLPVMLALAWVFQKYIEAPSIRWAGRVGLWSKR